MKRYNQCSEIEKAGITEILKREGWIHALYQPENELGMSKKGIGFMLKDLVIEE